MENINFLKEIYLFHDLDTMEMIQVAKVTSVRRAVKGEVIIRKGRRNDLVFVVKKGNLKVILEKVGRNGKKREVRLGTFKRGDHFGEISMLDSKTATASVTVTRNCELICISQNNFKRLFEYSPYLRTKLLNNLLMDLCRKIRGGNDHRLKAY